MKRSWLGLKLCEGRNVTQCSCVWWNWGVILTVRGFAFQLPPQLPVNGTTKRTTLNIIPPSPPSPFLLPLFLIVLPHPSPLFFSPPLSQIFHFQHGKPLLSEMPRLPEHLVALRLFWQSRDGNCIPVFYRELKRFKKCELLILSGFILMSFFVCGMSSLCSTFCECVCVRVCAFACVFGFGTQLLYVYLRLWWRGVLKYVCESTYVWAWG